MFNEFDSKVNLNKESKDVLGELEIDILELILKIRVVYKEVIILGLGVYEYKDVKVKKEVI